MILMKMTDGRDQGKCWRCSSEDIMMNLPPRLPADRGSPWL